MKMSNIALGIGIVVVLVIAAILVFGKRSKISETIHVPGANTDGTDSDGYIGINQSYARYPGENTQDWILRRNREGWKFDTAILK